MPEIYELTRYSLRHGPQQERLDRYLAEVMLAAWRRYGVHPVGVFETMLGEPAPTTYTLLRHDGLESVLAVRNWLAADGELQSAGAFFDAPPAGDPSFTRMESTLLTAFTGMPEMEVPTVVGPRVFELRRYESHGQAALSAKIRMFEDAEIAIFRRVGLTPVFFGECLAGAHRPSLAYLLVFGSVAEREARWAAFRADPEWQALVSTPGLTNAEIVCNVTSVLLRPTAYSEI